MTTIHSQRFSQELAHQIRAQLEARKLEIPTAQVEEIVTAAAGDAMKGGAGVSFVMDALRDVLTEDRTDWLIATLRRKIRLPVLLRPLGGFLWGAVDRALPGVLLNALEMMLRDRDRK